MKTNNQSDVKLFIGGCTGSNVVPGDRYLRDDRGVVERPYSRDHFGLHTTSLAVLIGKTAIMIDNGTGVGKTSEWLLRKDVSQVFILQTHYHLDHVGGLPNNSFLMQKGIIKGIFGPKLGEHDFGKVFGTLYNPPYWPVSPSMFKIEHPIHSFNPGENLPIMGGGIRTMILNHAGGSVGYRIPTPSGDIVIATDNELSDDTIRQSTADFLKESALAYVDVQYRDDEYEGSSVIGPGSTRIARRNWGHSTPTMLRLTYELMNIAPKHTIVGHHDPKRSDEDLFTFGREVGNAVNHLGTNTQLACEGVVFELEPKDEAVAA